jgi:hypothetical protein
MYASVKTTILNLYLLNELYRIIYVFKFVALHWKHIFVCNLCVISIVKYKSLFKYTGCDVMYTTEYSDVIYTANL